MNESTTLSPPTPAWGMAAAIAVFVVALPVISFLSMMGTLATGKLGEGPLGWVSVITWWAVLGMPFLAALWAVKSSLPSSRPLVPKLVVTVLLLGFALLIFAAGSAASIETTYNVSQGWNQPYLTNTEVLRSISLFALPLVGALILLIVIGRMMFRRFPDGWTRLRKGTFFLWITSVSLYSFEVMPLVWSPF